MFLRIETYPRRKSNKHTNKILRGFEWGGWVFCGVYLFVFFFVFFKPTDCFQQRYTACFNIFKWLQKT